VGRGLLRGFRVRAAEPALFGLEPGIARPGPDPRKLALPNHEPDRGLST
jgi:hypothetical protein